MFPSIVIRSVSVEKIIILAGNREQFERYIENNNLNHNETVYADGQVKVRGIEASKVITVGTWYEKSNAFELEELAKSRIR